MKMMKEQWSEFKKRLPDDWFLRLKNLALLVLIPIIFTLIFGMVYSKVYVEEIPLAIFDMDHTSASEELIEAFYDSPGFKIVAYTNSNEEIEEKIMSREAFAGLIIPPKFQENLQELNAPKVLMLIDETNIVIGNNALAYSNSIFNEMNTQLQLNILQKNGMVPYTAEKNLEALSFVGRILYDSQMSYFKYVFIGILGIFIQQTYLGVVAPILIEERHKFSNMNLQKETWEGILNLLKRFVFIVLLSFIGSSACLYIAGGYFGHPLRGIVFYTMMIQLILVINLTAISLILGTIFESVSHCVQFIMLLSIPTLLTAGYVWPEFMMPDGFGTVVRMVWPLIYYVNPMRELQLKGVGLDTISPYISGGFKFALFWVPVSMIIYILKIRFIKKVINKKESI